MNSFATAATALLLSATLAGAGQLVIKGSDTLGAKLVPQWAEAYQAAHPETTFNIAAEGSSTAFAALLEKSADIGMSSRKAKATEVSAAAARGVKLNEITVAHDGLGVIVNEGNPVRSLTREQVEQIFTGDVTDWSALGGDPGAISVYTRNTSSGTYADFKELAMSKRDYAGSAQKMAGNEQIASEVAKNAAGIGYVGMAYLKTPGIRALEVDGAAPTAEAVQKKSYPLARPVFLYTDGEPAGEAKGFIDYALGTDGQRVVEEVGFVPVK
ncbi:MAG TPA: phosphate ABC transporter substrate-binding protein [Chthoniobacteraceae bacterium]|nr:phosphate ABC transporter substrate-binding protein [Chthoniobacteraceae bacterium]